MTDTQGDGIARLTNMIASWCHVAVQLDPRNPRRKTLKACADEVEAEVSRLTAALAEQEQRPKSRCPCCESKVPSQRNLVCYTDDVNTATAVMTPCRETWHDEAARVRELEASLAAQAQEIGQLKMEAKLREHVETKLACWFCGTAAYQPNPRCGSHVSWQDRLQTEVEQHNAWRKRADEAEADLAAVRQERDALQDANDELVELARAVLQSTRDDAKGEQWTIRRFLEQRGVYNDNISGSRRLVAEACQNVLNFLAAPPVLSSADPEAQ